jgi:hypothetical protein
MPTYMITNRIAGLVLGPFDAPTPDEAVEAMIRDAGYRDARLEALVLETSVDKLRDELRVEEIDVPARIADVARSMVEYDREDVLFDAAADTADTADHWDRGGIVGAARDAGIGSALGSLLAQHYAPQIRDAYAVAWRAAVEADLAAR